MTKLLNRISLLLSISLWFFIIFSFTSFVWELRYLWEDWTVIFVLVSIIFWLIIKKIFLSKKFITERLEYFSEWIEKRILKQKWETSEIREKINIQNINLQNLEEKQTLEKDIISEEKEENKIILEKIKPETQNISEEIYEESKIILYIKSFFKENLLAKIGSILVFLWVLFLMSLIWNNIPDNWKIIIWFIIWFWAYFAWVLLHKKWYIWEWIILLWTWILINFLVILAWKYILDWNVNSTPLLSTWVTFLFLILNTLFWVVTSFVYKSKTLLIFSFIFAYLNPLLIWWNSQTPFVLIGYSMIISLWALFIWIKKGDNLFKISAFILGNILFLIAPFGTEIWWISKFVFSGILWLITLFSLYKSQYSKLWNIFILNFVFIILGLIIWWESNLIGENLSFITYMISILLFFWFGVLSFIKNIISSILSIILFPIIIIMWMLFTWNLSFIEISLWITVLSYLLAFSFLQKLLPSFVKYIFFGILGIFIFLTNWFLSFSINNQSFISFITILIISFIFIFTAYFFSRKKWSEYLYTIWTIWWIIMLLPVVNMDLSILFQSGFDQTYKQTLFINLIRPFSIIGIILFWLSNVIFPFFNKYLSWKDSDIKSLIIWSVSWLLFVWFELYINGIEYFPGRSLWLSFMLLAIIYSIVWFIFIQKTWIENIKKENNFKNIVYNYLWLSVSIFSLSIALIFSNFPEVISLIWLIETTILFFFYYRTKENKILEAWLILFIIWILKLFYLWDYLIEWDLTSLVSFIIIFVSFALNVRFLDNLKKCKNKNIHDILHIIWILILATLLNKIIPSTNYWWITIWISIFIASIWALYLYSKSNILKLFFVICFWMFAFSHIWIFSFIENKINKDWVNYLITLQYLSTALLAGIVILWNKINKISVYNIILNSVLAIYILIIVSNYIYNIIPNQFAITIFWWVVSVILIIKWISQDLIKYRTVWLYLLTIVLSKIFLFDLWVWLTDAVSRVIVLIILWVLMIFVSTRYTKKYWNNLTWEFSLWNLMWKNK